MAKDKLNFFSFLLMHIGFIIYSFYGVLGKYVFRYDFLSFKFFLLFFLILFVLFVYAFIWQQILKKIPLFLATANKAVTIIWGMTLGKIFFNESINTKMIFGAIIITSGLIVISTEKNDKTTD